MNHTHRWIPPFSGLMVCALCGESRSARHSICISMLMAMFGITATKFTSNEGWKRSDEKKEKRENVAHS